MSLVTVATLGGCLPTGRGPSATLPTGPPPQIYQALYRIRAEGPGGRTRLRSWIGIDSSAGRLSAEVLGPLGGTRAQIDADGDRTRVWLVEEGAWMDEASSAQVSHAVLGVPVEVPDLIALLRGRRPTGGRTPPYRLEGPDGSWLVEWEHDGLLPRRLRFAGPDAQVELEMVRLQDAGPLPDPFEPPSRLRRLRPQEMRALFLP